MSSFSSASVVFRVPHPHISNGVMVELKRSALSENVPFASYKTFLNLMKAVHPAFLLLLYFEPKSRNFRMLGLFDDLDILTIELHGKL